MKQSSVSRAAALKAIAAVPAVALGAAAAFSAPAEAAGASKSAVKYQDKPKNGQKCSGCRFYKANKDPKKNGTCTVVQGSISPNGWCVSYAKK